LNKILTQEFIRTRFEEYYRQNLATVDPPPSTELREFAFLLFKEKTMLRHRGFRDAQDFRKFLQSVLPSDVYYSCAYYENPGAEMSQKGWKGSDLVFDIDADHIPTPCKQEHDTWTCRNCGTSGRGSKPESCAKCGGQKFEEVSWPCDTCLEVAKKETIKLKEVLEDDFGFSSHEMKIAFSGHRGYHVHIENETVRTLNAIARKEIVDYMLGKGLDPSLQGFDFERGASPDLEDFGWRGRLAKAAYEIVLSSQRQPETTDKKTSKSLFAQRERILERWNGKGPWIITPNVNKEKWSEVIRQAVEKQSIKLDTVVTTDIHRLIRLANTLHGETGLKKIEVSADEIERFDPFNSAIAFKDGATTVYVTESPQFRLGEVNYPSYENEKVELPTAAAMLLLCKGAAEITEEENPVQ